jgi:hypothetical protein
MRYLSLGCFILSFAALGQTQQWIISGTVMDSATLEPLPLVAVQIKVTNMGVFSGEDGSFSLFVEKGDTLIFSRLGYHRLYMPIAEEMQTIVVLLSEKEEQLKDVVVSDRFIVAGSEKWKNKLKPSKPFTFENATMAQLNYGIIPTFGPGVVFRFGGRDRRMKRKRQEKRSELLKTRLYSITINSDEVKNQLMELFSISLETYYRKLEAFNKKHPEAAYLATREAIMEALIQFFAIKDP